jgi:Ca2+-transporting ATPase
VGSEVSAGTLVVRGAAYVEVERTGPASTMGRIAGMLGEVRSERTPLEQRIEVFGGQIARWVLALSVVLVVANVAIEGWARLDDAFLWAVALAVAAIPEGLPAVMTLTLALGVERMSKRRAVVRKLAAVEALGSVTVIATDKTGTITENRMQVRQVEGPDPERALRAMVLANDTEPDAGGDPLEVGLFEYARENGVDPVELSLACPRQSERSFDSEWKFMRVAERRRWAEEFQRQASEGLRVLALACGRGEVEQGLDWLGLVLFWDPPRAEVPAAVRAAQQAGVRVLMITGDHPSTAASVAQMVGIDGRRVVTGDELEGLAPEALGELAMDVDVFARVAPEHKMALVEALQARNQVVAVTGDGVNDAPALKRSDVGVAMGQRGSDVSREVADLVLLDDNFATIVDAIAEGRNIYANIQTFIRFLFSTNVALVLLVAIGAMGSAILGLRDAAGALLVPLTAAQLLWVNIIADGPPALAVGLDHTPDVMKRTPRPRDSALLDGPAIRFVLLTGGVKAGVGLFMLLALPWMGLTTLATRTSVFLYETLAQLAFVYPSRALTFRPDPNRILNVIVIVSVVVQPAIILLPGMRQMLGTVGIGTVGWASVAGAVLLSWLFAEVYTRWARGTAQP